VDRDKGDRVIQKPIPLHCETCGAIIFEGEFCEAHQPDDSRPKTKRHEASPDLYAGQNGTLELHQDSLTRLEGKPLCRVKESDHAD
jgi:hypothetical protein